jgi:hypothetical protein
MPRPEHRVEMITENSTSVKKESAVGCWGGGLQEGSRKIRLPSVAHLQPYAAGARSGLLSKKEYPGR